MSAFSPDWRWVPIDGYSPLAPDQWAAELDASERKNRGDDDDDDDDEEEEANGWTLMVPPSTQGLKWRSALERLSHWRLK